MLATPTQIELAEMLEQLAADAMNVDSLGAVAIAAQGAQIARRLDADAAVELRNIANNPTPSVRNFAPIVRNILLGVAKATRIDGAATTGISPTNVFHVQSTATAAASANASVAVKTQLEILLADEELPDDARAELEAAKSDLESSDDLGALKRLSTAAGMLSQFPVLASALDEVIRSVASYL